MGDVVAKIKVMPGLAETNLDELKTAIKGLMPEGVRLSRITEEPVAFGLKALMVTIVLGDVEGGTETTENAISNLNNVESVQVIEIGRAL